jgi:dTDP-4-dehydrorhamnose 3,5-epimerase
VLRGLHFQFPHSQGKLVSVLHGEVFDVAVDVRVGSPTFGRWVGHTLSGRSGLQMYVPEGLAHGFVVLSDSAVFAYKCTEYYQPAAESVIRWDDADLGIDWPVRTPELSPRDSAAPRLRDVPIDRLPRYTPRGG